MEGFGVFQTLCSSLGFICTEPGKRICVLKICCIMRHLVDWRTICGVAFLNGGVQRTTGGAGSKIFERGQLGVAVVDHTPIMR